MKKSVFKWSNLIVLTIIAGFVVYVWQSLKQPADLTLEKIVAENPQTVLSGYVPGASFTLTYTPGAIAIEKGTLYASSDSTLSAYIPKGEQGEQVKSVSTGKHIMDIKVSGDTLYVLHEASVQLYNKELKLLNEWEACSENSYFCRLAVANGKVYVTDSNNKLIWRFAVNGVMEAQIKSPSGFIVPGYQFAITINNDTLYCANPGKHKVERYTLDGKFIDTFGSRGTEEGSFAGCCNPCDMVITQRGELFTAEKGIARISTFSTSGQYIGTLLSNHQLENGNVAPLISGEKDTIVVAYKNKIQFYVFDLTACLANPGKCGSCKVDCPLRKNL